MSHKDTMSLNYTNCNGMDHNIFIDNKSTTYPKFSQKSLNTDDKYIENKKKLVKPKKMLLNGVPMAHFLLIYQIESFFPLLPHQHQKILVLQ